MKKMSKSDLEHYKSRVAYISCKRKSRYKSESEAHKAIKLTESYQKGKKYDCYYCELCHGWHLCSAENKFQY